MLISSLDGRIPSLAKNGRTNGRQSDEPPRLPIGPPLPSVREKYAPPSGNVFHISRYPVPPTPSYFTRPTTAYVWWSSLGLSITSTRIVPGPVTFSTSAFLPGWV